MKTLTRTHKLAVKNSIGQWRTLGFIIADNETANLINGLIADNRLVIALNDEVDINSLINIQVADNKGVIKLNNIPAIFDMSTTAVKPAIVPQKQTVMQQPVKQSAEDSPF